MKAKVQRRVLGRVLGRVLAAVCLCLAAPGVHAQTRGDNPTIMTPERGERVRRPVQPVQPVKPTVSEPKPRAEQQTTPRRRPRGSSTLSTIPTYQSPLTPLGTAPRIGTAPSPAFPASPAAPVPGVRGYGGIAVTPPRPAGQQFPARTTSCIHGAGAAGVPPGQSGTYIRNCVNR